MTERERLIDILKNNQDDNTYYMTDMAANKITDVLLKNGVVVPPVKIGQKLWDIYFNRPREWEVCYLGFNGEEWFITLKYFKNKAVFASKQIHEKYLGKLFYFTREDAEKDIKEREKK